MADQNGQAADLEATERVVLRRLDGTESDTIGEQWEIVGRINKSDKTAAIKAIAKDRPGKYRAPSLRAWKGGLEIVVPDKPKVEQRSFE